MGVNPVSFAIVLAYIVLICVVSVMELKATYIGFSGGLPSRSQPDLNLLSFKKVGFMQYSEACYFLFLLLGT